MLSLVVYGFESAVFSHYLWAPASHKPFAFVARHCLRCCLFIEVSCSSLWFVVSPACFCLACALFLHSFLLVLLISSLSFAAIDVCSHVWVLSRGHAVQSGPMGELIKIRQVMSGYTLATSEHVRESFFLQAIVKSRKLGIHTLGGLHAIGIGSALTCASQSKKKLLVDLLVRLLGRPRVSLLTTLSV